LMNPSGLGTQCPVNGRWHRTFLPMLDPPGLRHLGAQGYSYTYFLISQQPHRWASL
jgi:hypothetical protein